MIQSLNITLSFRRRNSWSQNIKLYFYEFTFLLKFSKAECICVVWWTRIFDSLPSRYAELCTLLGMV